MMEDGDEEMESKEVHVYKICLNIAGSFYTFNVL